jgi:Fic/DOC family.
MDDKYLLTKEQNLFLAKKLLSGNIFCGTKLEGSKITFPEVQTILDGVNVQSATINDIQTILNLKTAWHYLLKTIHEPFDYHYLCSINNLVACNQSCEWGVLRTGNVRISGTSHAPGLPVESEVKHQLELILDPNKTATDKALDYFLYGTQSQLFWEGNKRTSLLAANKILIENGAGLLLMTESQLLAFNKKLVDYYNTGNGEELKSFLYVQCIKGIEF